MEKGTKMQAKGKMERGKGKARQTYGKLTGDKSQQAKGAAETAVGRVKDVAGASMRRKVNGKS